MNSEQRFSDKLCGISAAEVGGLLSMLMRKEHHVLTSTNANKRVRKWRASLLGIDIAVTEVNINIHHFAMTGRKFMGVDFSIESMEWEFNVVVDNDNMALLDTKAPQGAAKIGSETVYIAYPIFEGDVEAYRSDMSMIRLMGLQDVEPAVMV